MAKWKDNVLKNQFGIPIAVAHYVPCYTFSNKRFYKVTYEPIEKSYPNRYRKKTFQKYHRKYYHEFQKYPQKRNPEFETDNGPVFMVESFKSPIKNFNKISIKRISKDEEKEL